ncbi:hypothetical protein ACFYY8_27275 [Streptosporangium sp. NPDC001559]|uniref:hypothetical protein n=1 Tax=Streptosporangium sp. NPDC001559 TaxID=3366187 RepID=UPI0036ED058C
MDRLEILIGRAERLDHVLIRVLGRTFPGHNDFHDGNQPASPIHARIGGFTAEIDLPSFLGAVAAVERRFPALGSGGA